MIKVLILEDEDAASRRLQKLVKEMIPEAEIAEVIVSVVAAINWFSSNAQPDLLFADIQLSDGSSFEIFKQVKIGSPVIFTTAYDAYAINAFKLNSVDYLLKPIKREELKNAIDKFKKIYRSPLQTGDNHIQQLIETLQKSAQYRQRFVIRFGEHMKTIQTSEIAYFYTENKVNFMVMKDGKRYPSDFNLDQLEELLDPKNFFRINRQFIISYQSIAEMFTYSKSRVLIKLNPPSKLETIVSTERSSQFKSWLAGE